MTQLRQIWSRSKGFRVILIVVAAYTVLRLVVQGALLVELLQTGTEGYDLQLYLNAASHLQMRQDVYLKGTLNYVEFYQYSPAYALAFTPFLWLPLSAVLIIHTLAHVVAYGLLYWLWDRTFKRLGLGHVSQTLAWLLPLWLVFSQFWADLGYLNVYVFMALLATLLIDAILNQRLGLSVLWLSIILQIKPQWAFAAGVPLLLGQWRFFLKLMGLTVATYAVIVGAVMLIVGPLYGWQQYLDYFQFLRDMRDNLVWRGPDAPFLGYDHSITQIVVYLLGATAGTLRLATMVKVLLLVPLMAVSLRSLLHPAYRPGHDVPQLGLDFAFVLYLGAFIWLDVVWEVSFGIVIFTYLLAVLDKKGDRIWAWIIFLPYALTDLWQLASIVVFGFDIIVPGPFVLTDPSIYIPLAMIVILTFYTLFIKRLWIAAPAPG
jgi:hypothetical protein